MPSGRIHELANTLFLVGVGSLVGAIGGDPASPSFIAFAGGYLTGTFLITPDLDLAGKGNPRPLKRWGPLAFLWLPYGRVSAHRGLSHTWLAGPILRLVYLGVLLLPAPVLLGVELTTKGQEALTLLGPPAFLGYLASQWGHLLLDGVPLRPVGASKRRRKRWVR